MIAIENTMIVIKNTLTAIENTMIVKNTMIAKNTIIAIEKNVLDSIHAFIFVIHTFDYHTSDLNFVIAM
jgi:hypothetical protein